MKLETFFEKFELFADAPNAVQKMRELTLQLSIQGRLVSRRSDDNSVVALLSTIAKDRAEFVRANGIGRQRPIDPITDDQYPHDLPPSWLWVRLGSLCRVQAGFAFPSSGFVQDDSGLPIIRIRDITKDRTQVNLAGAFREEFVVNPGDFLVGMDGNFTVAKWRGPKALLNQRVARLQWYSNHLEPSFFAVATQYRLRELQGTKAYTTVDHLSSGQIENALVPLPPVAEQKRIVAKVDELMALCDRLEARQNERQSRHTALARAAVSRFAEAPSSANLEYLFHPSYAITPGHLRKTILTLAVQGKLVPQDPRDEYADVLATRLKAERETLAKAQCVRLPRNIRALVADDWPHDIPESWQWNRLGDLALVIDYGTSHKANDDASKVPVYRMGNILGGRLIDENLKYVDAGIDDLPALYLKTNDILFNRTNSYELVGKTGIYIGGDNRATFASYLIRVRLPEAFLCPSFFSLVLNAPYFRQTQIEPEITQQCGQANFNGTKLASTVVPVPPLAEQRRIVAKVDELMKLVDQLEAQLTLSYNKAEQLMQAIVAELASADRTPKCEDRSAVACYVLHGMRSNPVFGRTAEMKVLYLAEAHLGLPLGGEYFREAAGPFDKWIYDFERRGEKEGWFKVSQESLSSTRSITRYQLLPAIQSRVEVAIEELGGARESLDRLLDYLKPLNTEDIEIVATLFAAWNDAVLDGVTPDDDWIIREVRENWHPSKQRFAPETLSRWLTWMRRHDLVPTGKGRRTQYQPGFELVD